MKSIKAKILYAYALFALVFTCLCPHTDEGYTHVYAAENTTSLDGTAVMDDLQGADLAALTAQLTGDKLYVISFTEYCFAFDKNANGNYGLYVYVYNPAQKGVVTNSTQNKVNFGVEYNGTEVTGYDKFDMRALSVSEDGKYIKFKIVDKVSDVTGETILSRVSASKLQRIYDVAEIEVCHAYGEIAESYGVGKRYICTGFAAGYGQNAGADSTLDMFSEESETVQLDVHATQYRLDGNNGKNIYTQDSLHSVYFTVPKEKEEAYGEMTAVHAQWLDAVLKPFLVTGNQDAYNAILPYLGEGLENNGHNDDLEYIYLGACDARIKNTSFGVNTYEHRFGFSYNAPVENGRMTLSGASINGSLTELSVGNDYRAFYGTTINPLYLMYNAGDGLNSADGFVPPAEGAGSLAEKMQQATEKYGGELVEERYSRVLFESVDEEKTDAQIKNTDEFKIMNVGIDNAKWWERLFGKVDTVDKDTLDRFVGVKAIEPVTENIMKMDAEDVCEALKIGAHDYDAFKQYYESNKDDGTVYLFRYKVSDYISQEATLFKGGSGWRKVDTNAYIFQEECDVGFDIIDITLTNEQGEHVLGVAAKPIDVFPTPTPPLITTTDKSPWGELLFWLKMIVGIILGILFIVLVCVVVPPVGTALVYVVALPFKGIAFIGKKLGSLFNKKE